MLATNEQEKIITTPQVTEQTGNTTPQTADYWKTQRTPQQSYPEGGARKESGTTAVLATTGTAAPAAGGSTSTAGKTGSTYENTMAALRQAQGMGASFTSDYDTEIERLYDQIANRDKFSYDYSTDPLYGQYREQYTQMGNQAMRDTVGQGAALTGGYDNSYAQSVGQQQYGEYLARLNDVLPELYSQAFNVYQSEGDRLNQLYALAGDRRDNAYERYRDALADAQYNDALSIQQAMDRAALGDWAAYADVYGEEAAKKAAILSNPQAAWASGMATAQEIKKYTGKYPKGYKTSGAAASGGGFGGWSPRLQAQIDAAHEDGKLWAPGW